jgi:hypothetical protein
MDRKTGGVVKGYYYKGKATRIKVGGVECIIVANSTAELVTVTETLKGKLLRKLCQGVAVFSLREVK